jgi:tripartite-type tricarboxylate transporter receptor subunit TctC
MLRLTAGAAALVPASLSDATSSVGADAFPSRTIVIVVPFPPGGSNDIIARLVGQFMSEDLKAKVIVENRAGGTGTLGAQSVARAEPDGHTLLVAPVSVLAINQWLFKELSYDPARDFAPLTLAAAVSNVLVVHPSVPASSVAELVRYAKANAGKLSFASMGSGTTGHLCGEMFKKAAGVDIVHVPYKGSAPAMTDLLGGQVHMMFDNLPTSLPHIRSGRLRALAVTGAARHPQAPELPTVEESGYPGVVAEAWFGFVAPTRTPPAVRSVLVASMTKALNDAAVKAQLEKVGLRIVANSPEAFAAYIAAETLKWKKVVEESGAKLGG